MNQVKCIKKSASHVISFKLKLKKATTLSFTFWDKPSAPCSTHYWCITGDGLRPGPQRVTKKYLNFLSHQCELNHLMSP